MQIDSPQWYLKQECPCCGGLGALELLTCESCLKVIAICDEMLTVFCDPKDIRMEKISYQIERAVCPYCGEKDQLRRAKDLELISIGLTQNEYE